MKNIIINKLQEINRSFEIVERKGVGHPDTLCDAIAERASRDYSKYCLTHFGKVAHHWFDKVMLLGGESTIDYGKGELFYPYTVIFVGKAALKVGDHKIPIENILHQSASDVLSTTLKYFFPEKHLKTEIRVYDYKGPGQGVQRYRPKSSDDLLDLSTKERVSNDCNICVGYAPLSLLESLVLSLEQELSAGNFKNLFQDTGYDIKIIGVRHNKDITLQVNLPFIANHIQNRDIYEKRVEDAQEYIKKYVKSKFNKTASVLVNPEKCSGRPYLTVTGSVADTGDVGVVGRGNRINGLITPFRPMSIEASAGKNPLDHTGKLYSILAMEISQKIFNDLGLRNEVILSTTKEKPLNQPDFIYISIEDEGKYTEVSHKKVEKLVEEKINGIFELSTKLIFEGITQW
jgi:S-adenosylmethionine synthetase